MERYLLDVFMKGCFYNLPGRLNITAACRKNAFLGHCVSSSVRKLATSQNSSGVLILIGDRNICHIRHGVNCQLRVCVCKLLGSSCGWVNRHLVASSSGLQTDKWCRLRVADGSVV